VAPGERERQDRGDCGQAHDDASGLRRDRLVEAKTHVPGEVPQAIEQVKPGNHWNDPHDTAIEVLTDGLLELGILRGTRKKLISDQAYSRYYMHRTGHWLGMDVHDVGDYKLDGEWRMLDVGMILTVEPGLYFPPARGLAKKWWNIGIRIEDDVLVTPTGHDVLSKHIPKGVAEIERLMS